MLPLLFAGGFLVLVCTGVRLPMMPPNSIIWRKLSRHIETTRVEDSEPGWATRLRGVKVFH